MAERMMAPNPYLVLDRKSRFFGQEFEIRSTKYETMTKIKML